MLVESGCEVAFPDAVVRLHSSARTDVGAVRGLNEDSFLAQGSWFVVADGMGGHALGDEASQRAVAAFADLVPDGVPAGAGMVLEALDAANRAVIRLAEERDLDGPCGTTITGIALVDVGDVAHWMAFNIGDSRVYQWDGRRLSQLTVDHSEVQELIDRGELTPEQAQHHPRRNVVTRALGAEDDIDPDVWIMPARPRQTFIVCSDGLTRDLPDAELARIIAFHAQQAERESPPMSLADRLVGAALAAGGRDNITVVVVESELVVDAVEVAGDPTEETSERTALPFRFEDTLPRS